MNLVDLNSYLLAFIFYILIFLFIIYKFTTWTFTLESKYGVKGPTPKPLFGNTLEFMKYGFQVCDVNNQKKYGDIYPIYQGRDGIFVVTDEAILRQMLVKDAKSFIDRPSIRGNGKIMKQTLLRLKGKDWERVRTLITPIFTSGKLKRMCPMIVDSVNKMIQRFAKAENINIDAKQIYSSFTMDVIARTMFGIELNISDENSHNFINWARKLFIQDSSNIPFVILNLFPHFEFLVDIWSPYGIVSPESIIYFVKTLAVTIENRRKSKEEHHDFLTLMLNAYDELIKSQKDIGNTDIVVPSKGLTEEEIMAQCIIFLVAGYETTAGTLTFCTYYLALNPDAQDEIYEELLENLPAEKEITYDMLGNLTLLEQCLHETQRICPSVSRISRICTSDTTLISSNGKVFQVQKGMRFVVPVHAIHRDERIWPNPDKFDIHRFDKVEKQKRSLFSFMPFGMGPRICVAMRFALLEAKLALAHLLKNYKIVTCHETPKQLTFKLGDVSIPNEPMMIRLEKRITK